MHPTRTEALTAVLDDIAAFQINYDQYHEYLEAQWSIDSWLCGKINSLLAFCQTLGWSEIFTHLQGMTELRGNAPESLSSLQDFVIPEARRLLAATDIETPSSPTQWFWEFVHPRICALARPRFEAGFFAERWRHPLRS
jgi:hypothetical protein